LAMGIDYIIGNVLGVTLAAEAPVRRCFRGYSIRIARAARGSGWVQGRVLGG